MTWKNLKNQLRYYAQYFPFTINTFIGGILLFLAYKILHKPIPKNESAGAFQPFIQLMGKMVFWFLLGLLLISIISTIATWIYYLILKKNRNVRLQLAFSNEQGRNYQKRYYMNAMLEGVRRPILGFVKGRLFYDDHQVTDKFSLLSDRRERNKFWRTAIAGKSRLELPDIKEYELRGGFIFFEDMLQLLSLPVSQTVGGHFYQPPVLQKEEDQEVFPRKTENIDVRIEQMRRVEGEHLNYKDFEAGDDVRRIVWKVYAKNKDLVVRVPEMFEPFASHLYFYASFHTAVKNSWLQDDYLKEMLNYYKNNVWTVYDALSKKEWEMRYIADQAFNVPEHLSIAERVERSISNASWHIDKGLQEYFNPKQGAVLCISSFTSPEELRGLIDSCDASTVIYLVKCSKVFAHLLALGWLKQLIFLPSRDRLSRLREKWTFSPMRLQVQKREKELEEILNNSHVRFGIL